MPPGAYDHSVVSSDVGLHREVHLAEHSGIEHAARRFGPSLR